MSDPLTELKDLLNSDSPLEHERYGSMVGEVPDCTREFVKDPRRFAGEHFDRLYAQVSPSDPSGLIWLLSVLVDQAIDVVVSAESSHDAIARKAASGATLSARENMLLKSDGGEFDPRSTNAAIVAGDATRKARDAYWKNAGPEDRAFAAVLCREITEILVVAEDACRIRFVGPGPGPFNFCAPDRSSLPRLVERLWVVAEMLNTCRVGSSLQTIPESVVQGALSQVRDASDAMRADWTVPVPMHVLCAVCGREDRRTVKEMLGASLKNIGKLWQVNISAAPETLRDALRLACKPAESRKTRQNAANRQVTPTRPDGRTLKRGHGDVAPRT